MADLGPTAFTGDRSNAAAVASYLYGGGLRDSSVLAGPRGLRFFRDHGLTEANQAQVIERLQALIDGGG